MSAVIYWIIAGIFSIGNTKPESIIIGTIIPGTMKSQLSRFGLYQMRSSAAIRGVSVVPVYIKRSASILREKFVIIMDA